MSRKPINKTKEISAVEAVNTKIRVGEKKITYIKKKQLGTWRVQ